MSTRYSGYVSENKGQVLYSTTLSGIREKKFILPTLDRGNTRWTNQAQYSPKPMRPIKGSFSAGVRKSMPKFKPSKFSSNPSWRPSETPKKAKNKKKKTTAPPAGARPP